MAYIKINRLVAIITIIIAVNLSANAQEENATHQYLFSKFSKGNVVKKSGSIQEAYMNYNCITEEIIFVQDGIRLALANLNSVDYVVLFERIFIPNGEVFLELLVDGEIDLLLRHKAKADFESEEVGYGGTSELSNVKTLSSIRGNGQYFYMDMPDVKISPDPSFFLRIGEEVNYVYNKRTVQKLFPESLTELKGFFKQNKIDFENVDDMTRLVTFLIEL